MKLFCQPLFAFLLLATPLFGDDWVRLSVKSSDFAGVEAELLSRSVNFIGPDTARTELTDYGNLVSDRVDHLHSRLTPGDPRWDPWLEFWVSAWSTPDSLPIWVTRKSLPLLDRVMPSRVQLQSGSAVSGPLLVTLWTLTALGSLATVVLALAFARRRSSRPWGMVFCALMTLTGLGGLFLPSGEVLPRSAQKLATMYKQHLWYQTALPYGGRWEDYSPGRTVAIHDFRRIDHRIVEDNAAIFTADGAWFAARAAEQEPTNVARLLGSAFP